MNSNIFIRVLYGPYECHGTIRHRIQKIYGILTYLKSKDYQHEVVLSPHINRLTIEMNNRIIYTCDIRFLKFNILSNDDAACKRIINSINLHEKSFSNPSNVPKFAHISEGMRMQREQDIESSFMESTSYDSTIDNFLDPYGYICIAGDEEEEEGGEDYGSKIVSMLQMREYDQAYFKDYGCYIQEPFESKSTSKEDELSKDSSTISSCVCFSIDPPSLYSICRTPALTHGTTDISIKHNLTFESQMKEDEEEIEDLSDQASASISNSDWEDVCDPEAIDNLAKSEDSSDNDLDEELFAEEEITDDVKSSSTKSKKISTYLIDIIKKDDDEQPPMQKTNVGILKKEKNRSKICPSYEGGKCVSYSTVGT